jgi:cation-transporting ATPase 13A3/4/5
MGSNIIDIASKSVGGLLVDEVSDTSYLDCGLTLLKMQVLHPFYVFQIASIVLWSLDDYYYYAFAIAVISISSILGTLIETKRTIERMREMSRFHCEMSVLVDGECELSIASRADIRGTTRL